MPAHRLGRSFLLGMSLWAGLASAEIAALQPQSPLATAWQSNILKKRFDEPSGIVYHPTRKTLFVVSDDGRVAEFTRDGERLQQRKKLDGDLEGITVNPATGLLYIADEGRDQILELDPDSLKKLRRFKIKRRLDGVSVFPKGGNGIEAVTFVPDAKHPQGGTFWMANQGEGGDDGEPAWLAEVELPLQQGKGHGRILRAWRSDIRDISGLHYLPKKRRLAVISDLQNLYLEVSLDGELLREKSLPGFDQEGIAVDADGTIYLAIDGDGDGYDAVMKLQP